VHHVRARRWMCALTAQDTLLLTPWTEMGFMRVGLQARLLPDIATGRKLLAGLAGGKAKVGFCPDGSRADDLPAWATTPALIGDGHLTALAAANRARLATLDEGIADARLIP
jgi:predicted nucleic acid-binding protein